MPDFSRLAFPLARVGHSVQVAGCAGAVKTPVAAPVAASKSGEERPSGRCVAWKRMKFH